MENPHDVVKTGDIVKVKVLEVDVARKRIGLTMRLDENPLKNDRTSGQTSPANSKGMNREQKNSRAAGNNAMGNAFADALKNWKK